MNLWLYDQVSDLFQNLAINIIAAVLVGVFLLGMAVLIAEGLFVLWLGFRGIGLWIWNFPAELKKCLTYQHCSIPGCKGRHASHL